MFFLLKQLFHFYIKLESLCTVLFKWMSKCIIMSSCKKTISNYTALISECWNHVHLWVKQYILIYYINLLKNIIINNITKIKMARLKKNIINLKDQLQIFFLLLENNFSFHSITSITKI